MNVNVTFDLRGTLCPVRHQGTRPTCLAFSLSELNRFHGNGPDPLSPEFLYQEAARLVPGWQPGDGLPLAEALLATSAPGQPLEAACPYTNVEPISPIPPANTYSPMHSNSFGQLSHLMADIRASLESGAPIGLGILLTPSFYYPTHNGVIEYQPVALPDSGHAVLAVGLGEEQSSGEPHVLLRNSWGDRWGISGHAWISASYIATHALCAFGR